MRQSPKIVGRVIVVGGEQADVDALAKAISIDFRVLRVYTCSDTLECARLEPPHAIVVRATGGEGPEYCTLLRQDAALRRVPILLVTGDQRSWTSALQAGAIDCLSPDANPDHIRLKIGRLVGLKRTEDKLRLALDRAQDKVSELESVIDMVTHDLKSPVVATEGFVRLLRKRLGDFASDPAIKEILQYMDRACTNMRGFLDDLSQSLVTQTLELDWKPFRLEAAVQELLRNHMEVIEEKGIRVAFNVSGREPEVFGDRRRILQVLDNLLLNALKHMGSPQDPRILIEAEGGEQFITTRISDNGIGIPPEYRDKIFNRFFRIPRRHAQSGSGLGLSISRAVVESHGGEIWVEAGPYGGASFVFTVPRFSPEKAGRKAAEATAQQPER